jgi:hypothetical protein
VVVGDVGFVIVALPGLPDCADHVPIPLAAIVALPPGKVTTQLTVLSGPASGFAVMNAIAVSVQPFGLVQMKL